MLFLFFFFSSRRRHTRWTGDWSSDVCSSDLGRLPFLGGAMQAVARGALLPVVAVNGLDHPKTAYAVGTGLEYQLGQGAIGIVYSLERYDFPAQATVRRLEQVSALTVRGALRFPH